jgi:hypothetical protein
MSEAAGGARSDDSASLKRNIAAYIPAKPDVHVVQPPLRHGLKSAWGFNHPMIAVLLCPKRLLHDLQFDIDDT